MGKIDYRKINEVNKENVKVQRGGQRDGFFFRI